MHIKGTSVEVSEGTEKHVIEHWRKGNLCHKGTKKCILAELYTPAGQKIEILSNQLKYLAEGISRQSVENVARCLLAVTVKCEKKEIN